MDVNASKLEEIVLSTWVYKCFVARELDKIVGGEEVGKRTLANMVKVGLWCIQDEPFLRPSMKSVVLMLEGITDISVPPCPTNVPMQTFSTQGKFYIYFNIVFLSFYVFFFSFPIK